MNVPVEADEQVDQLVHEEAISQDLCCMPLSNKLHGPEHISGPASGFSLLAELLLAASVGTI